jgi:hypothetical protein
MYKIRRPLQSLYNEYLRGVDTRAFMNAANLAFGAGTGEQASSCTSAIL